VQRTCLPADLRERLRPRDPTQTEGFHSRLFIALSSQASSPFAARPDSEGKPWSWLFSTQLSARLHIPPHRPEPVAVPAASWEAYLGETPSRCLAADRASRPRFRQFLEDRIYNLASQQHPFSPKSAGRSSNAEYTVQASASTRGCEKRIVEILQGAASPPTLVLPAPNACTPLAVSSAVGIRRI
jgi:hypothetical protein